LVITELHRIDQLNITSISNL